MIEQIAKAICAVNNGGAFEFDATGKDIMDDDYQAEWEHYIEDAKAALREMIVPNNRMVATGCAVSLVPWNECSAIYSAMIRKAVAEK